MVFNLQNYYALTREDAAEEEDVREEEDGDDKEAEDCFVFDLLVGDDDEEEEDNALTFDKVEDVIVEDALILLTFTEDF